MAEAVKHQVPPSPFNSRSYTIEQIDGHLTFISNVIAHSSRTNRAKCFAKANEWLDKRLELTKSAS